MKTCQWWEELRGPMRLMWASEHFSEVWNLWEFGRLERGLG